jgi:putative DNA primase/helicase
MKDGPSGAVMRFRLDVVELATDERDAVTSLVAIPADGEVAAAKKAELTGDTKIAFDLLCELTATDAAAVVASTHAPKGALSVDVELWRKYFHNGTIAPDIKPESRDKAFSRAWKKLKTLELIGIWNGRVWLADKPDNTRQTAGQTDHPYPRTTDGQTGHPPL